MTRSGMNSYGFSFRIDTFNPERNLTAKLFQHHVNEEWIIQEWNGRESDASGGLKRTERAHLQSNRRLSAVQLQALHSFPFHSGLKSFADIFHVNTEWILFRSGMKLNPASCKHRQDTGSGSCCILTVVHWLIYCTRDRPHELVWRSHEPNNVI